MHLQDHTKVWKGGYGVLTSRKDTVRRMGGRQRKSALHPSTKRNYSMELVVALFNGTNISCGKLASSRTPLFLGSEDIQNDYVPGHKLLVPHKLTISGT